VDDNNHEETISEGIFQIYMIWAALLNVLPLPIGTPPITEEDGTLGTAVESIAYALRLIADEPLPESTKNEFRTGLIYWLAAVDISGGYFADDQEDVWKVQAVLLNLERSEDHAITAEEEIADM